LGTIKIDQPNPEYARGADNVDFEGNPIPELIDIPIAGALFGSGIIAFDEFEHSGIFKETQHKQDTVMMFQKFMNRLDSDTHLIKKRLTEWGRDLVVDCQRSLWATTLPPQGLEKVILTKGVFQRMWLYVREVPESLKMKMEEDYIDNVGVIDESTDDSDIFAEEFATMMYDIYKWCKDRHEKTGDKRKVVIWSDDAKKALKVVWKSMRKYMDGFSDHIFEALNTFLMNTLNNVSIAAGICAIAEKSPTIERRHVMQAKSLTDKSFDSITTWFSNKLKKNPKRIQEKGREAIIMKVFQNCPKKDGWVAKTQMVNTYMKMTQKGRATFYREWDNVEHLFDERRINGNRVHVRRKQNEK
jgi:histone H3/H4